MSGSISRPGFRLRRSGARDALSGDACSLYDLDLRAPVAWVFGGEGQGVSPAVLACATRHVLIPMPGAIESLNVGAAVAVCLFEQARQLGSR
ncbi:TrmH family RNA methyltransferase [Thauera humireducens]|uniref:TrmH family RNA methyltransferase n=1 Tax=Thauera humireducens TaxID=1134435 RepID=UPI00311FD981